jgi:hypothetical protein
MSSPQPKVNIPIPPPGTSLHPDDVRRFLSTNEVRAIVRDELADVHAVESPERTL